MPRYTMRRTWPDDGRNQNDFVIRCDGEDVGRLYELIGVGGRLVWHWTIYSTNRCGRPETFEEAKRQWKASFEADPQDGA